MSSLYAKVSGMNLGTITASAIGNPSLRYWLAMAFEVSLLKPIGEPAFGNFRF